MSLQRETFVDEEEYDEMRQALLILADRVYINFKQLDFHISTL